MLYVQASRQVGCLNGQTLHCNLQQSVQQESTLSIKQNALAAVAHSLVANNSAERSCDQTLRTTASAQITQQHRLCCNLRCAKTACMSTTYTAVDSACLVLYLGGLHIHRVQELASGLHVLTSASEAQADEVNLKLSCQLLDG